jgi:hypothetical protein
MQTFVKGDVIAKSKKTFRYELICIIRFCSVISAKSPKFISNNYHLEIIFPLFKKEAKDFIWIVYGLWCSFGTINNFKGTAAEIALQRPLFTKSWNLMDLIERKV